MALPYLDIRDANAFEPVDMFCSGSASLCHLAMLTLLKLRLRLDLETYDSEFGFGVGDLIESDRPVGKLVRSKIQTLGMQDITTTIEALTDQYHTLCRAVNDANPYFWDALVDEADDIPSSPSYYTPHSIEEAHMALSQCKRAWQESEDAIVMIEADTCSFVPVYKGPTAVGGAGDARSVASEQRAGSLERRRGVGHVFPSAFKPPLPDSSPAELFSATRIGRSDSGETVRFVSGTDPRKILVYADGACTNNGQPNPRGGWAVVYSPANAASGRLEDKGPFGHDSVATSNRAELRAAIAVLRLCDWRGEGFGTIVIATDSSYVADGATGWAKGWVRNGWKTRTGGDVKNKDLWELLLGEVESWGNRGLHVALWKIPRELNADADIEAKEAAENGTAKAEFRDVVIGGFQSTTTPTNAGTERNPRILALCLEHESLLDDVFGNLVSQITSKAKMERATTPEAALSMLSQEPRPSVILITDGALTRQRKVWERVMDHLREGSTVVLAGCFSSMVTMGQFDRFFARLGLPWRRGSYTRATVKLRPQVVGGRLASRLPLAYSQKALFVKNVDRSAAWYTENETSNEAAVAFAKVGSGRLGYVGDVNGEEGSDAVVLAMCGLLD
jgi:ribonuclease HI